MKETLTIIDSAKRGKIAKIDSNKISYNKSLSGLLKKSKEIYCVSNQGNFDGMGTPTLLIRNYNMDPKNICFILPKDFSFFLEDIKRSKPSKSVVVFADLSLNEDQIPFMRAALSKLKENHNDVIWLDHHPWNQESLEAVKGIKFGIFGESRRYCATELTYVLLCKKEKGNKLLIDMVHVNDFALKSKKFNRINKIIGRAIINFYLNGKNRLAVQKDEQKLCTILAKLDFKNKFILRSYNNYQKTAQKAIKELKSSIKLIASKPYRIAVGFSNKLQINQACEAINKKTNSDIDVYVDVKTGKSGIRSRDGVDCSKLALALNGGGHPQASGFDAKPKNFSNFNTAGKENFISNLQNKIKIIYK